MTSVSVKEVPVPAGARLSSRTYRGVSVCTLRHPTTGATTPSGTRRPVGRGMTLIEVLVASLLLGVGVAGLISVATLAMRNQQHTELRAAALCLAQEKLSEVELAGPHVWMLGHPTQGTRPIGGTVYSWTIRIEQLAAGELFGVQIEVEWSGPGKGGTAELETWLNDYDMVTQGEQTGLPAR